jgi:protein TonB
LASSLLLSAFASQASASDFQARYDKDSCAMPEYPAPWRTEEQQGDVKLELLVGADGNVVDAKLLESSGYSTLDKASLRASVKCKFKPVAKNGEMAQGWVKVQYVWVIN